MTSRSHHRRRLGARLTSTTALALLLSLPAGPSLAAEGEPRGASRVACGDEAGDDAASSSSEDCDGRSGPPARSGRTTVGDEDGTDQSEGLDGADPDGGDSDPAPDDGNEPDGGDLGTPPEPRTIEDPLEAPDETTPDDPAVDIDEDALNAVLIDPTLEDPDVLGVQESRSLGSAHATHTTNAAGSAPSTGAGQLPAAGLGPLAALIAALTSSALGGTLLRRTSRRRT